MHSALATIGRYAELAAWHANTLGIPSFTVRYESLLAAPKQCVSDLSDFAQVGTKQRIDAAAECVRKPQLSCGDPIAPC